MAALLGQVCWRKIDRDPPGRHGQTERAEGGPNPLAALPNRLVGKSDDGETGLDGLRQMDLYIHRSGHNAFERKRRYATDHPYGS